jgi:hypothetical protein
MAGEIEIENVSSADVEIEFTSSLLQYLNLIVADANGQDITYFHYGDLFSPLEAPHRMRLPPGARHVSPVCLLGNVAAERQVPGRYQVQAVFKYKDLIALSEVLALEIGV